MFVFVCVCVCSSVFICAPAAEPSWHSAETWRQKTLRLLWNVHQRCQFSFSFEHRNKWRLFFNEEKVATIVQHFAVLSWVVFFHSLMYFLLCTFVLVESGPALGHARNAQHSCKTWTYCCKYIVTLSDTHAVNSLHMYYGFILKSKRNMHFVQGLFQCRKKYQGWKRGSCGLVQCGRDLGTNAFLKGPYKRTGNVQYSTVMINDCRVWLPLL